MKTRWILITLMAAALAASPTFAQRPDAPEDGPDSALDEMLLAADADIALHSPGEIGAGGPGHGHGRMGRRGGGMGHGRGMIEAMEGLDLTDAQRTRLREIRERQARAGIQAHADLQIASLDLHKLLQADSPQRSTIDVQIDKMSRMRAGLQKARIASMLEARSVLTPDQQKQMKDLRMHRGRDGDRDVIRERVRERIQRPGGQ